MDRRDAISFLTSVFGSGRSTGKCSALLVVVYLEFDLELRQHRAAEGEIAEMVFEGREAGNDLAVDTKGKNLCTR